MPEKIYSVGALTLSIRRNLLANNEKIAGVWIEGEVSGLKTYSSGHRYFTLKDKDAQISCVLFAFRLDGCDDGFKAVLAKGDADANGLKVQVIGELDLNMSRGQYSFKVARLRLAGLGDRMAQYNALKAKLEAEGLNKLDHPELRRPLPFLPHRIAIVTSPAGAVIHDMCTVLTRRFPNLEIRLFPVKVQGEGAANEIVGGIRYFQTSEWRPDVLIVGRGGGSVEDLWAFNEEPVVRAVASSEIPVISAVGHESDTTLCDHVADLRAGTPSIAAERAVPVKAELAAQVNDLAARLARAPRQFAEGQTQQLDYLSLRLERTLDGAAARVERRLRDASSRLAPALKDVVARLEVRLQRAALRLEQPLPAARQRAEAALREQATRLDLLNPYAVLGRGYSITVGADGHVVRRAADVAPGDRVTTRLAEGEFTSVAV
ncbi:MAG: exodeoxyribonuclease VII large subunit [Kiritimatiellae bacterium]|nr:exodeoxyribonuclease VII large subunit [Kiritimatiellia bacterium]